MKKILSSIYLLISIILISYTFYKSEIFWEGNKRDYYLIYYITSVLLLIYSFLTFFIKKQINNYLQIIMLSTIFSFYIFEAYLTLKYEDKNGNFKISGNVFIDINEKKKIYKSKTGKDYDTRSRFEVYNDLIKKNQDIKIIVHPSSYIFNNYNLDIKDKIFPLSGISNAETIFCEEMGYYSFYKSDRFGFNNPDYEWDKKSLKYILIGDSFTHGACVNRPNDIASVLRNLSGESVLNLGYSGNGPLLEFATLREYLKPNIENIIWFYYEGNDMEDFDSELRSKHLVKYINDLNFNQNLKNKQNEIDNLANLSIERGIKEENLKFTNKKKKILNINIIKHIKLTNLRKVLNSYLPTKYQPQSPYQPKFKNLLKLSKELALNNNSNFYFVYLPSYTRYKTNYDNSSYNQVKKVIKELDINFIDVHKDIFKLEANPLKLFPFESSKHYNIEGYKKISALIEKVVANK